MAVTGEVNVNVGGGLEESMSGMSGFIEKALGGIGGKAAGGMKGTGGILSGLSGLSSLTAIVPAVLGIAAGVGFLVSSSKMLQRVLGTIAKLIGLMLKPLGDMLAVGLMPIIMILKPIARFFNTLMRPYLRKSMAAMRAGGKFMREGNPELAFEAFGLGAQFLLQPFADLFANLFPILGPTIDEWGVELDRELTKAIFGSTMAVSKGTKEMVTGLEKDVALLNKLEIEDDTINDLLNQIKKPLKSAARFTENDWQLYDKAVSVLGDITTFVSGTGGSDWGFYDNSIKHLKGIQNWVNNEWKMGTNTEKTLKAITNWTIESWTFDKVIITKMENLKNDVNNTMDEINTANAISELNNFIDTIKRFVGLSPGWHWIYLI